MTTERSKATESFPGIGEVTGVGTEIKSLQVQRLTFAQPVATAAGEVLGIELLSDTVAHVSITDINTGTTVSTRMNVKLEEKV